MQRGLVWLALCAGLACGQPSELDPSGVGLPNPASQHCVEKAGSLRIETEADGGQIGICTLSDGRECEEWAYFRGACPATNP